MHTGMAPFSRVGCGQEELEKQARLADKASHTFKPTLNSGNVSVPGRLQLHTKEGRDTYLSRIKVRALSTFASPFHDRLSGSQEAEEDITQAVEERRMQQEREELDECTFRPEVRQRTQRQQPSVPIN